MVASRLHKQILGRNSSQSIYAECNQLPTIMQYPLGRIDHDINGKHIAVEGIPAIRLLNFSSRTEPVVAKDDISTEAEKNLNRFEVLATVVQCKPSFNSVKESPSW